MTAMLIALAGLLLIVLGGKAFALAANANVSVVEDETLFTLPVAGGVHLYRNALAGKDPAGYLKPFEPGDEFVGLVDGEVDNTSGSDGDLYADVLLGVPIAFTLASVAAKDVGKPVYATADDAAALTGHYDGYMGRVMGVDRTNTAIILLKRPGEEAPNGQGAIKLELTGMEAFAETGATAGTSSVGGFDLKSILGTGWVMNDAEDGGIKGDFDNTAEVALCSCRQRNDPLPVDKGITMEVELCVADKGDDAALDIDIGLGTALTTNSEANIDHADMVQLAGFHLDGNSDNINFQSDDNTTDVTALDTTIDNDSTTDTTKKFKIVVRPDGEVEAWINGARVLSTTAFGLLSTAAVAAFINMEKTSNDTTASIVFRKLRVCGGMAA